jgi:superfamily II DNA/RNA helicase
MTISLFSELSLRPELQQAIADQGYTTPTPIQAQAIPPPLHFQYCKSWLTQA